MASTLTKLSTATVCTEPTHIFRQVYEHVPIADAICGQGTEPHGDPAVILRQRASKQIN